ncbi:diguanylate cyclase [Methylomonas lenta]|uniref:cyclic-guanylate-specific phosphodiesterase n=1 Tax=Methylomonas lenta TaxID=980561 RepID=A0A177NI71_9GAMM|nr:EAL domain-containing protein [Methylomonas lenta]OAI17153.1 diguanylate cyclase [Methylomonas lenta]
MDRLIVRDCLLPQISRVLEEERPGTVSNQPLYAVFRESVDNGIFCGLATAQDVMQHPSWIFADLTEHRESKCVSLDMSVDRALRTMDQHDLDALPVLEQQSFVGVVTRQSILNVLLQRERTLLKQTRILNKRLAEEHEQIVSWSEKLAKLHEASRSLLTVLAHTSIQNDLLQIGIESLAELLEARYGAIGILDASGELNHFVYTGINAELAERIGQFPQGKGLLGVVIQNNVSLRLDDMSSHPQSVGFPEHHPPMKTLLAVPIAYHDRVYGRIYLSDKENGELFSKQDEDLAFSFAHSLSLVLDNAREIEEVKQARQSLDYMAHFDALTDLPNRTLLKDRMDQAISQAQRKQRMVGVLFLDLDNFKVVNDTIGHTCGDELLKSVAQQISDCLREGDTVARLGGDEFIVLLPDLSDTQDAAKVANKILELLNSPFDIGQHEVYASVSIGISIYPHNSKNMEGLLSNADGAMYYAKKLGKNNYQFFTPEMNRSAQQYIKLEKYLRRALEQNEFVLHYQPQVDVKTGRIIGMEALIRWMNPKLGLVNPADFIPLAEDTGLIVPIGAWVLKTACKQAKFWQQNGFPIRVAVNMSSRQFHQIQSQQQSQHPLLDDVLNALDESDLPPELLELEITESILMQHLDTTMEILNALKNIGIRLSIDDFGTGYSSLSYLKRFPIDILKIDKSFVNDITTDPSDKAIVAAITVMAQQLKLEVVAEGVETLAQLEFLRKLQCNFVQGYYFSKPLSADDGYAYLLAQDDLNRMGASIG